MDCNESPKNSRFLSLLFRQILVPAFRCQPLQTLIILYPYPYPGLTAQTLQLSSLRRRRSYIGSNLRKLKHGEFTPEWGCQTGSPGRRRRSYIGSNQRKLKHGELTPEWGCQTGSPGRRRRSRPG